MFQILCFNNMCFVGFSPRDLSYIRKVEMRNVNLKGMKINGLIIPDLLQLWALCSVSVETLLENLGGGKNKLLL